MQSPMLRICLVNTFFPPWRGGAETYTYNLSRQLAGFGHEVKVLCASNPLKPGRAVVDRVEVHRLRSQLQLYGVPITSGLPREVTRQRVDIFHANFPNPYNTSIVSFMSARKNIPALVTWHNDLPPVTRIAGMLVGVHDALAVPIYLPKFRKIISTSRIYAENSPILQRYWEKVVIVPNGVDCKTFNLNLDMEDMKESLHLDGVQIILFVGALTRWHRYKGLDVLIKAFAHLCSKKDRVKLVIVGGGHLEEEYRSLALSLGLGNKTIFVGDVNNQELPRYYAASDFLVLPSKDRSEGFGLTILEANASGKPVVGSNVGGIPGVIRHGYNGLLVEPNNPEALANTMLQLLGDEDLRVQMGKNGLVIAEKHDWSIVAKATEKLYYSILGEYSSMR